jgi:hypothetical protein
MTIPLSKVATKVLVLNGVTLVPHLFSGYYALPGGLLTTERELLRRGAKKNMMLLWPKE